MKLKLHDLSKSFAGRVVLRDVRLELEDVRALVLIGPSGGGKSTLLRILGGLETPDAGVVEIDDRPLPFGDEAALREYRRRTGFVFQSHNLFPHLTAVENIVLPLRHVHGLERSEAYGRAFDLLARFRLDDHAHRRPFELSGGQRQRVAIARSLAVQARILLLDEPTSALDPEMTAEVLDTIATLRAEGRDFVLVTHQMGFARRVADHLAFVGDGGIAAHGPGTRLLDDPGHPAVARFLERVLGY
ncbi:MAG: amino acid ABC transporter ATP-binding protein [Verrucomicrobiales bacterium]|nr:amino acid ABC transporter ATP-binding protein [Verrucomicrobiales bacterium]